MGYKFTSDIFQISANAIESAPGAGAETTINVSLDSLSREVLVIMYVDLDLSNPDIVPGSKSFVNATLRDNSGGTTGLSDPRAIVVGQTMVLAGSGTGAGGIEGVTSFQNVEPKVANMVDTPLYVTATDDLYLAVQSGGGTASPGQAQTRIFARRAKADADTYAAILTSQYN